MSIRCLGIFALLAFALPVHSYAQSLGDVARQVRAERQEQTTPHTRVIANDDIATSEQPRATTTARNGSKAEASATSSAEGKNQEADTQADDSKSTKGDKLHNDSVKEREAREVEIQKRTNDINQKYVDQIATLREQINTAQLYLVKLQTDQAQSTNDFRRSVGGLPSIATYEQEQRAFIDQIDAQNKLISSLKSQLEDAQEAARHAGVPHATD
jgi:hypothetical protein